MSDKKRRIGPLAITLVGGAVVSAITACTGDASMDFKVYVELTPQIDRVDADGRDLSIDLNGALRSITFDETFASYDAAMGSSPVEFHFWSMGQRIYVGRSEPGLCHARCTVPGCPDDNELTGELVQVPIGDFTVADFDCVICSDSHHMVDICPEAVN